jgi:hypothetical protein
LEARKSEIKVKVDSVPGEHNFLSGNALIFTLEKERGERKGEVERKEDKEDLQVSFLIKTSQGSILMTSSDPNCLPKTRSPNTITWGLGLPNLNGGTQFSP